MRFMTTENDFKKAVFDDGEIIESVEYGKGEDNDYPDPVGKED